MTETRPSSGRLAALAILLATLTFGGRASADGIEYVLDGRSSITIACRDCGTQPASPRPLLGTFQVTRMPVGAADLAAVTRIDLRGESISIVGNGFLRRLDNGRQALVIDAEVNGERVLLTSGRRQKVRDGHLFIILSARQPSGEIYLVVLSASPAGGVQPDVDGDGRADEEDNCPTTANTDQADADADGVGDACDGCTATVAGEAVTAEGCSLEQLCPCEVTAEGELWPERRAYLRCVVDAARQLRREGKMSRAEGLRRLRRAARSACGQTIVASM